LSWALGSFDGNALNPGRMNLFRMGDGYAVVDYGHNPGALEAMAELARSWHGRTVTVVASLPGDRDRSVQELAARALARGFDRIILKEDEDLRGAAPGATASAVEAFVRAEKPDAQCVVMLDEFDAVRHALDTMSDDEIVLILTDATDEVCALLREQGASPTESIAQPRAPTSSLRLVPGAGPVATQAELLLVERWR
jgi:cyanophycin synthetase